MDQSGRSNKRGNKKGIEEPSDINRSQNWSAEQTTIMLNLIREEQLANRVAGPGTFTIQFWNRLAVILNSRSVPDREGHELRTRFKTVKYDFYDYKRCVEKSGWGWDPVNRVAYGPENEWQDLKEKNSKLYKCKSKPFEWFDIMKEIVGSNMASGHCAAAGPTSVPLEDLLSQSDSADSNQNAEQELNDFDFSAFRNQWGTEISMLGGDLEKENNFSGKRPSEGSDGIESDETTNKKTSKGGSSNKNNGKDVDSCIHIIVEESIKRNALLDKRVNKNETVADKLLKIRKVGNLSWEDFMILQSILKDAFNNDMFLSIGDDELDEWVHQNIEMYKRERGL